MGVKLLLNGPSLGLWHARKVTEVKGADVELEARCCASAALALVRCQALLSLALFLPLSRPRRSSAYAILTSSGACLSISTSLLGRLIGKTEQVEQQQTAPVLRIAAIEDGKSTTSALAPPDGTPVDQLFCTPGQISVHVLYGKSTGPALAASKTTVPEEHKKKTDLEKAMELLLRPIVLGTQRARPHCSRFVCLHVDDFFMSGDAFFVDRVIKKLRQGFSAGSEDKDDMAS